MYFIIRDSDYIDMTGVTFREFLNYGYNGERATIDDWARTSDHAVPRDPHQALHRSALLSTASRRN